MRNIILTFEEKSDDVLLYADEGQIMRFHNGSLKLTRSDERRTVFTLEFM